MRTEAASALRFGCLAAVLLSAPALAVPNDAPLTVAVREAPPFAMRGADGAWEGVSVELFREVAETAGVPFAWRELPLDEPPSTAAGSTLPSPPSP
jgi:hypothetical protein